MGMKVREWEMEILLQREEGEVAAMEDMDEESKRKKMCWKVRQLGRRSGC